MKQHNKFLKKQITKQLFFKTGMYYTLTLSLLVIEKEMLLEFAVLST